jgi:tRNA synthetases class I (I, L, M and V)/Protein of unknown function (DUF835)/Anticodon-binding domain of tRNA ligase
MRSLPARYDPAQVEADVAAFWKSRGLPTPPGAVARGEGPPIHQVVVGLAATDTALAFLQRALRADAEARFLTLQGHPSRGRLVARRSDHPALGQLRIALPANGVWVGGGGIEVLGETSQPSQIQQLVDRLAVSGLLVSREGPLRSCPACRAPRSPEGLVYIAEDGDAYLVRFLLEGPIPRTSLLVWIDSAWKLLGTSAVLVHPDLSYARVRYRRRGTEEVVLVVRSAIDRLRSWLGGSEIEILEERPGTAFAGLRYEHPLATEFPTLASLPTPAGQIALSSEVDDSGTGVVALVPAHGAGDAVAAANLGIPGWPVVGPDGQLVRDLQHKYAGLTVDVAEAFVLRDLGESGLLFAQLRVRRGVPHCAVCGSALYWQPSRAWCLDASSASPDVRAQLLRITSTGGLPKSDDPVAWPVSEWRASDGSGAPRLLECGQCGRLAPMSSKSEPCPCGAPRRAVARRLLPSLEEPLATWARDRPFPGGDPVRFYVPDRRRGPTMTLQATAVVAADAAPGDVRTVLLPTLPADPDRSAPPLGGPSDPLRAALLRIGSSPRAGDPTLGDRRRQEERRLRKVWQVAREAIDACMRDGFELDPRPIVGRVGELLDEDRAFLSLFERMRSGVQREYESGDVSAATDHLARFFEADLRAGYLPFARSRLDHPGLTAEKVAVFRVLGHVLPLWAELYAPIAPFAMEAIHRAVRGDTVSLFERTFTPGQELLLDSRREQSYARWRSIVATLDRVRTELGVPTDVRFPSIVLAVTDDAIATDLRAEHAVIERLARAERIEVGSPSQPWSGRRVQVRAIPEEVQRAYPFQAPRILRMLEGMSATRLQESLRTRTLELVLEGHPVPISASMLEVTESLPDGVVPISWALGDLFVTLPTDLPGRGDVAPPPLSPDGFLLVRVLRRRIGRAAAPSAVDRVEISATGSLAEELAKHSIALSRYLQGIEIVLTSDASRFVDAETTRGRTRRGVPWSVWVPGLTVPKKERTRSVRPRRARPQPVGRPIVDEIAMDFLDDTLRAREAAIRAAVVEFDHALGRPLVGPAKLARAWESGLTSFDAVAHAPYEQLVGVPGFGPTLAAAIVEGFGGTVPPHALSRPPTPIETARPAREILVELPEAPGATQPEVSPDAARAEAPREIRSPAQAPPSPTRPAPVPPVPASVSRGAAPARPVPTAPVVTSPPPAPPGSVPMPAPAEPAPVAPPAPTGVEVWAEPSAERPWAEFLGLTDAGAPGLCLSREFPERLRTHLGSRNVRIVWLSNVGREGSVRPGDLDSLRALFRGFLEGGPGRAAYIEGVEYLVRIHGTARTLDFLHELHALAIESGARLFLPVNPALMDPSGADRLTAEFRVAS